MIPPIFYGDEWGMVYLNIPYELPKKKRTPFTVAFRGRGSARPLHAEAHGE